MFSTSSRESPVWCYICLTATNIPLCYITNHAFLCVFFQCRKWCKEIDQGKVSDGLRKWLTQTNIKIESSAKGKNEEEMSVKEEEGELEGQQVPNVASCSSSMAME